MSAVFLFLTMGAMAQANGQMPDLSETPDVNPVGYDMLSLFAQGGGVVIVFILLLLVTLYLFIQRMVALRWANKDSETFMSRVKDYLTDGKIDSALKLCKSINTPVARIVGSGIASLGRPFGEIALSLENRKAQEVYGLKSNLSFFATILIGSPLLGLAGTACELAQYTPDTISLTFTLFPAIAGLTLGILTVIGYFYLISRINRTIHKIDIGTAAFLAIINEPVKN